MTEERTKTKFKKCPKCDGWIPENYTSHEFSKKLNAPCGWYAIPLEQPKNLEANNLEIQLERIAGSLERIETFMEEKK